MSAKAKMDAKERKEFFKRLNALFNQEQKEKQKKRDQELLELEHKKHETTATGDIEPDVNATTITTTITITSSLSASTSSSLSTSLTGTTLVTSIAPVSIQKRSHCRIDEVTE
eukprot:Awhi_evm1s4806